MAKRTIKPSKQKPEVEQSAETLTLPEQPVEVKADAADLLDSPPIPATLTEPDAAGADTPTASTAEVADVPQSAPTVQDDPFALTPEEQAEYDHAHKLELAKEDHLQASLALREAQSAVKAARDREKDALEFYIELQARGPVIPKPVTPPGEQSGTQQPLPSDNSPDSNGNAWRSEPLTVLPLDNIKGLGETKRDALLDACPTLGAFVDKQVEAGASNVSTVLPKGIGKAITDPLEEMLLNWICKWRSEHGTATNEAAAEPIATEAATATSEATSGQESGVPSFTEWELMTEQQQRDWVSQRGEYLVNARFINLTAAVQSGRLAQGRGESLTDCPYIPGEEMDDWILGFQGGERTDESDARWRGDDPSEQELAATGVAGNSTPAYSDLDDI